MTDIQVYNELSELNLTEEQLNYILNHIQYDTTKSTVKKIIKKKSFNVREVLDSFLSTQKERTAQAYKFILDKFIQTAPHVLDITKEWADQYVVELSKKYSSNYVGQQIAAISSFYSKLVRWEYTEDNPFSGVRLPKVERTRKLVVPSEEEVKAIFNYCEKGEQEYLKKTFIAVKLMAILGIRIGAISDITISEGRYFCKSKGKNINGSFPTLLRLDFMGRVNFDESYPFSDLNVKLVQAHLTKTMKMMYNDGLIKHVYHAHSFRHYSAVKLYKETKDIYQVSKFLNHSNVGVTQRYLDSLQIGD